MTVLSYFFAKETLESLSKEVLKPIIIKLTELRLNVSLDEIKNLFALLQNYVNNGEIPQVCLRAP